MIIFRLFLSVMMFVALAVGGIYVAAVTGVIPPETSAKIPGLASILEKKEVTEIVAGSQDSIKVLTSATQTTANSAGQVLGSQIQAGEQPLAQRAFEFARYSYCQEVVKDYEKRNVDSE